jgi:hypothetical protein
MMDRMPTFDPEPARPATVAWPTLQVDEDPPADAAGLAVLDPGIVVLTCANCGAAMDERKCKLICRCGYFLSCSDYY